jgi:hypothetical protein
MKDPAALSAGRERAGRERGDASGTCGPVPSLKVVEASAALGAIVDIPMSDRVAPAFFNPPSQRWAARTRVPGSLISPSADLRVPRSDLKWTGWHIERFHLDTEEEAVWRSCLEW